MTTFQSETQYLAELASRSRLPEGFRCAVTTLSFTPAEKPVSLKMNLCLILADEKTPAFGAVFTRNRFPGAPVIIGKQRLASDYLQGCIINNKISNVCAPGGVETACRLTEELGRQLQLPARLLLPFSTGIIGWQLPVADMIDAFPTLTAGLSGESILPVARGIMTTDSFAKVRQASAGSGGILGIAKGAGMIEPNMATMLCFILSDLDIPREELRSTLAECVAETFNCISVDSDQSTSDTVLCLSSCRQPHPGHNEFKTALFTVCSQLAEDIVRNGEGTGHVIRVKVGGNLADDTARSLGKAVINSPLVKTAIFGNDPNVGRIVSSIGDFLGNHNIKLQTDGLVIKMGGIEIFSGGSFLLNSEKEKQLSAYLAECQMDTAIKGYPQHDKRVEIGIFFGGDTIRSTVLGSDLSYEYVRENADYRS